jgi:hypothetical protein
MSHHKDDAPVGGADCADWRGQSAAAGWKEHKFGLPNKPSETAEALRQFFEGEKKKYWKRLGGKGLDEQAVSLVIRRSRSTTLRCWVLRTAFTRKVWRPIYSEKERTRDTKGRIRAQPESECQEVLEAYGKGLAVFEDALRYRQEQSGCVRGAHNNAEMETWAENSLANAESVTDG